MRFWAAIEKRLTDDWRYLGMFWSTRLNGAGLLLISAVQIVQETWNQMPPDLRHLLPYAQGISIALFVAGLVARVIPQPVTQTKIAQKMEARRGID